MGTETADAGTFKWGANLNIGYYDQRLDMLKPQHTLMDAIQDGRDDQRQVGPRSAGADALSQ